MALALFDEDQLCHLNYDGPHFAVCTYERKGEIQKQNGEILILSARPKANAAGKEEIAADSFERFSKLLEMYLSLADREMVESVVGLKWNDIMEKLAQRPIETFHLALTGARLVVKLSFKA